MSSRARLVLALLWLAALLCAAWMIGQRLQLSGDLRAFMPSAQTPAQKLLIDELGEGPGSRLLLIALSGAGPETLAQQSQRLREELAARPEFTLVANGFNTGLEAIPPRLRPYRYLLSPTLDTTSFDEEFLRAELQARLQDLGSPAASMIEPLLPADPTLEMLKLAESWQPANAPQRRYGVWFDRNGQQALLVAETRAAGFDPNGQQAAVSAIESDFQTVRAGTDSRMAMSGPGAFSVEIGARTEREARWIGLIDTIGLIALLWLAYRTWRAPLLGVLPLASAGLAGLGAVAALFEGVHGITVAFGFTLIGVAQDYPIHLFSHQRAGVSPRDSARALWPTLATGVVATCIAYLTFFVSGVAGLKQLAVFTIIGLATAALTTRFWLPALLGGTQHAASERVGAEQGWLQRDPAQFPGLVRAWQWIVRLSRPRIALAVVALLALATITFAPGPFWQNDLSKLTPVPADALVLDARFRHELGAPDVRYVLALERRDMETALQAAERLQPALERLISDRVLGGYDIASRYLPSAATQRARQAKLPDSATLQDALDSALAATPFRADVFAQFITDVDAAKRAAPLTRDDLDGTPLAASIAGLLLEHDGRATALASLSGITDPAVVAQVAQANGTQLLDLKQASESLVAAYRNRVLAALALAAVLLAATVWLALRSTRRTLRVLLPMALTTLIVLALLRAFAVELNLFHLVALILAAGLGLDYALFFEHAGNDRAEQLRALHAIIVCSLMTVLVFSLLALSSIPVLRAIGLTVTLGVVCNFVLGLLIARHPDPTRGASRA